MELSAWLSNNIKLEEDITFFQKDETTRTLEIRLRNYNFSPARGVSVIISENYVNDSDVIYAIERARKAIERSEKIDKV